MTIREATPADAPRIVEMCARFLGESSYAALGAASPERLAALTDTMIDGDLYGVFVAEAPNGLVGVAAAQVFEHPMFDLRVASEVVWWVEPEARGGSAGLRLLNALERWAAEVGAGQLHMIAPTARVGEFYQRRGYAYVESAFARRV